MSRAVLTLLALLAVPAFGQLRQVDQGRANPNQPWWVQGTIACSNCGGSASVLMADNTANPTIPQSASFGMVFDGVNWDRWTGAVTGPLTDAQLRAAPVPVSGTFFQATQPVSAASLPLPTGAATEATLATRLSETAFTGSASGSQGTLNAGTLAATTTAAAVAANVPAVQVTVQNDPDNAVDILCGNAATQPIQLKPGDGLTLNVTNVNVIFCKTVSSTGTVAYVAR